MVSLTPQPIVPNCPDTILPEVSFDINHGRLFKDVQFDYDAYISYLTEKGLSPEQINATALRFSIHGKNNGYSAGYNPITQNIWIFNDTTGINKTSIVANRSLTHELKHKQDFDLSRLNRVFGITLVLSTNLSKIIGKACLKSGLLAFPVGFALGYTFDHYSIYNIAPDLAISGLGSVILGKIIYILNPYERSARAAEKSPKSFVTFTPRTQLNN